MTRESEAQNETTLDKIRTCINNAESSIDDEVARTNQNWFSCFRTVAWKNLPTLLDTARMKGEISEDSERAAQAEIENIINQANEYQSQSGSVDTYEAGVPSMEIRQELVSRLTKILDLMEHP